MGQGEHRLMRVTLEDGRRISILDQLHGDRKDQSAVIGLNVEVSIIEGSICFTNTLTAARLGLAAFQELLGLGISPTS